MQPLFMWAGGKTEKIKHYRSQMDFEFSNYCEPFFGGGAMFIDILKNKNNPDLKRIVINDINTDMMNIYKSIKNDVDTFTDIMDRLESEYIPLSKPERKEYYFKIRKEHAFDYEKWTPTIESAHLYFLMKTCFNGLWQVNKNTNGRFGAASGLLNQKTNVYDKGNVLEWSSALQSVEIYSEDWEKCIDRLPDDGTFYFFDPPYRDCSVKYALEFGDVKLKRLIEFSKSLTQSNIFLCNSDIGDGFYEPYINNGLRMISFSTKHTAGRRKRTENGFEAMPATEVMLYKKNRVKLDIDCLHFRNNCF